MFGRGCRWCSWSNMKTPTTSSIQHQNCLKSKNNLTLETELATVINRCKEICVHFNEHIIFVRFYTETMICNGVDLFTRKFYTQYPDLIEKIRNETDTERFSQHFSSWNSAKKPVFVQIPTRRGFGYSFNLVQSGKMFNDGWDDCMKVECSVSTLLWLQNFFGLSLRLSQFHNKRSERCCRKNQSPGLSVDFRHRTVWWIRNLVF